MEIIPTRKSFRQYIFFWTGQLFSLLGSMVVFFVLTFWIADVYRDPIISAFASFLSVFLMIICMPIAGVVADRIDRKKVIIVVDSGQAFATFLLILFFQLGLTDIWIIYLFISLRSICQAFHIPIVNAIIPTMVPKDKLARINGINYLFTGVVQLFAPFLGAVLLVFFVPYLIFWVDIITFFIALIPLLLITIPSITEINHTQQIVEKRSFKEDFKMGFRILKIIPGLMIIIILSMLSNFLIKPAETLMALFIIDVHGGRAGHLALVQIIFTGGIISGSIFASIKKNWNNKIRVIFTGMIIAWIGYMVFAIAPVGSFLIMGIGGAILGFVLPIINSLAQTFVQTNVPPDKLGRVSSIDSTLSSAISPIGSLVSGPLALLLGIPALLFSCALLGILCTISFWLFTGIRRLDMDKKDLYEEINGKIESIEI
jgi:DHA3 family macrolide efflux protein-like MFS transporter